MESHCEFLPLSVLENGQKLRAFLWRTPTDAIRLTLLDNPRQVSEIRPKFPLPRTLRQIHEFALPTIPEAEKRPP